MARARSPNRDKAKEIYLESNGDIKLIDIAKELNIKDSQVRKWKSQDKWDEELNGALPISKGNVTNENKKSNINKSDNKKPIADEVKEVLDNTELTDKQRLFCVIYAQCMNAAKAYQKAYKSTYETAMVEGSKNLRKPKVKKQLDKLISSQINKEFLKRSLIQKYIDIAFSDITEYVKFGKKYEQVLDKEGNPKLGLDGEFITRTYNYMELNESNQIDGTLISEISEGKDGIKIKLLDKLKAMDFLTKHCNLLNDEEKTQLEIEYKKLQNKKVLAEINKITGDNQEIEDTDEIDGDIYGD